MEKDICKTPFSVFSREKEWSGSNVHALIKIGVMNDTRLVVLALILIAEAALSSVHAVSEHRPRRRG
jgi:hypothetical protein